MTLIEGRLNHDSAVYDGDSFLIANNRRFERLLTPNISERLTGECLAKKIPYIDPLEYNAVFKIGITRMCQATSNRLKMQYELATASEKLIVAPTLAEDLFQDYKMKLLILSGIGAHAKIDSNYVRADSNGIEIFRTAFSSVIVETGVSEIRTYSNPEEQMVLLLDFAAKARKEALPILLQICEPIFASGEKEMDILFRLLGKDKKKYILPVPRL